MISSSSMVYVICIDKDDKIDIAHMLWYENDECDFLPNEYGRPIQFNDEEDAINFILSNVKCDKVSDKFRREYFKDYSSKQLREKYLK